MFPLIIDEAIANGRWVDPGSDKIKDILSLAKDESDLLLFESREMMENIGRQLDSGGYVDDPEFCMIRNLSDLNGSNDMRLVFSNALFIGGSKYPGDDVLLAIDASKSSEEQMVLWFDWSQKPPNRWQPIMSLSSFLSKLTGTMGDSHKGKLGSHLEF
jgi:hypothetical protein